MLTFDSVHEYYLGNDASIYYCKDHEALILTQDHSDRLLVNGLSKETMLKFATKLYRDDLNKTIASIESDSQEQQASVSKDEVSTTSDVLGGK